MHQNFYVRYHYKNIIPFNFKKKRLRIHSHLIGANKLQSYSAEQKIKFWYNYFGINGLKKDNTILAKKFLNRRLSVFFISKFNMIESKWGLPKIYDKFYKKYIYKKKYMYNLIKSGFILKKDYSNHYLSLFLVKFRVNLVQYYAYYLNKFFFLKYKWGYLNVNYYNRVFFKKKKKKKKKKKYFTFRMKKKKKFNLKKYS